MERISADFFGGSAPMLPRVEPLAPLMPRPLSGMAAYAERQAAQADEAAPSKDAAAKTPRNPKQAAFRRRSRNAVLGAAGAAALYALATDALGLGADKEGEGAGEEQKQ